jgi:hypothetical protein
MGEIINLRQARKARDRKAAEQAAAEARVRHGRTKGQRAKERTEAERLARTVDQSRREPAPADPENPPVRSEDETDFV